MKKHKNSEWTSRIYIQDPRYAINPDVYVRAFLNIQKDIHELFRNIEPVTDEVNFSCIIS